MQEVADRGNARANKAGGATALEELCMQVDHPNVGSSSKRIDQGFMTTDSCLHWFAKSRTIRPEAYPFKSDPRLRDNLCHYLSGLFSRPDFGTFTIRHVSQVRVCVVNGLTCETSRKDELDFDSSQSAIRSTHTSHVRVYRPDIGSDNIAVIRVLLKVLVSVDVHVLIDSPPIEHELFIAVVDHLKTYREAYGRDFDHISGMPVTSDIPHHEYNRNADVTTAQAAKIRTENDLGGHFISVRRIVDGVTLKEVKEVGKPSGFIIITHPKGI